MQAKRRAIFEAVYKLPSDGRTALYDFYALYALWWDTGGGKEAYNDGLPMASGKVAPRLRAATVEDVLESCSFQLAQKLGVATMAAVNDEVQHVTDQALIPPEAYAEWAQSTGNGKLMALYSKSANRVIMPDNPLSELGTELVSKILSAGFWKTHADLYGGIKWATILRMGLELIHAAKHGMELKRLVKLIDQFYDMEHNTASLATKMGDFSVSKVDLDVRARISGTQTFVQYVSPVVARLLQSSAGYSNKPVNKLTIGRIPRELRLKYWTSDYDENNNTFLKPKIGNHPELAWPATGAFYGEEVPNGFKLNDHIYPAHIFDLEKVENLNARQLLAKITG